MNIPEPAAAASAATLALDYLSSAEMATRNSGWWDSVLGVVGFGRVPAIVRPRTLVTASMTPRLGGVEDVCEVWRVTGAPKAVRDGVSRADGVRYRYCEDLLFGYIVVDEHAMKVAPDAAQALIAATEQAYQSIFALLTDTGHRHLLRIWNYLPDINGEAGGEERYRHFNSARETAFRKSGRATRGTVPAASALGSPAGSPISIYFLATRRPPVMIENPRQTSAYHYPPQFGRHRPIFSRACVWGEGEGASLFISGTASIVGHESIHRGDVAAQTRETMANIGALLAEANRVAASERYDFDGLKLKVYVRRPADRVVIAEVLTHFLSAGTTVVYLLADVCRNDLLVEIEATGEPSLQASHCR